MGIRIYCFNWYILHYGGVGMMVIFNAIVGTGCIYVSGLAFSDRLYGWGSIGLFFGILNIVLALI